MLNGLTTDEVLIIVNFINSMEQTIDVDSEYVEIVNKHFFELI